MAVQTFSVQSLFNRRTCSLQGCAHTQRSSVCPSTFDSPETSLFDWCDAPYRPPARCTSSGTASLEEVNFKLCVSCCDVMTPVKEVTAFRGYSRGSGSMSAGQRGGLRRGNICASARSGTAGLVRVPPFTLIRMFALAFESKMSSRDQLCACSRVSVLHINMHDSTGQDLPTRSHRESAILQLSHRTQRNVNRETS